MKQLSLWLWMPLIFGVPCVFADGTGATNTSQTLSVQSWQTPLAEIIKSAPDSRKAVYAFLSVQIADTKKASEKKQPDWKQIKEELQQAERLCKSPLAVEKRRGLEIANREANTLGVVLPKAPIATQIAEGFIVPYLESARSEASHEISRPQLLQNISVFYLNVGQTSNYRKVLRSLILATLPADRAMADWARFQLAQSLSKTKEWSEAVALLEQIETDSLKSGSQKLAAQWKREHLVPSTSQPSS